MLQLQRMTLEEVDLRHVEQQVSIGYKKYKKQPKFNILFNTKTYG